MFWALHTYTQAEKNAILEINPKMRNIYFCLELDLKDTSTQGHRSPGVLNKSTQINEKNVVTPTLEHSSAIQGK